ncbi:MAG: HAD family hydrolase [Bacillaceae bacterium]
MKAIIFDFDGTIANTLPLCYYAFQDVFKTFDNRDLSAKEIVAMFGPSETGIIRENLIHTNKDEAIELYYADYAAYHDQFVKHNEEIIQLLTYLKEQGMKLGIVTGKARRSLEISLKALHMDSFFDVIITGDDVNQPKPHPEGLLKALAILGVRENEAIFIGDSDADIKAGVDGNVYTVGVHWLPDYQTTDFTIKPDAIFDQVSDFLNTIKMGVINER